MSKELFKVNLSSLTAKNEQNTFKELLDANAHTQNYQIVITEIMAKEIIESTRNSLKNNGRVELKNNPLPRIVKAFSESAYLTQNTFADIMDQIVDLFYYIKNEIENALSDDDLISEMLNVFNNTCYGDIENMQSKGLEKILRKIKWHDNSIWDNSVTSGEDTYWDINREELIGYEEKWRE